MHSMQGELKYRALLALLFSSCKKVPFGNVSGFIGDACMHACMLHAGHSGLYTDAYCTECTECNCAVSWYWSRYGGVTSVLGTV